MDVSALVQMAVAALVGSGVGILIWSSGRHERYISRPHGDRATRRLPASWRWFRIGSARWARSGTGHLLPNPASAGSVTVLMTYTKDNGSTRVHCLTIHSRNLRNGRTTSLNCQPLGAPCSRRFRLGGISRLELASSDPPVTLTTPAAIAEWVERRIPVQSSRDTRD